MTDIFGTIGKPAQALYHFISGFTSKIAGGEIGLGAQPEITLRSQLLAP
jgi:phosphoenolpyruvate carboxykinase (ATP)